MTVKKTQPPKPKESPAPVVDTEPDNEGCPLPVATEHEHPHGLGENPTYKSVVPNETIEDENGTSELETFVGGNTFIGNPAAQATIVATSENETTVTFNDITETSSHGINDMPWPRPDSDFNTYHMS